MVSIPAEKAFILSESILAEECLRRGGVVGLPTKEYAMQIVVLVLFIVVLLASVYSLKISRTHADQRAREKRRNEFHDRV